MSSMRATTRFLDLPTANRNSSSNLCESKRVSYIKFDKLVGFNSDTCNTMKGQQNGVV